MPVVDPAMMNPPVSAYGQKPGTLQQWQAQTQAQTQPDAQQQQQQQKQQQQQQQELFSRAVVGMAHTPQQLQHMIALAAGMATQATPSSGGSMRRNPKAATVEPRSMQFAPAQPQVSSTLPDTTTRPSTDEQLRHHRTAAKTQANPALFSQHQHQQQHMSQAQQFQQHFHPPQQSSSLQLWMSQQQLLQQLTRAQHRTNAATADSLPQQGALRLLASSVPALAPQQSIADQGPGVGWPMVHPHPAFGMAMQAGAPALQTTPQPYAPSLMHPMSTMPWPVVANGTQSTSGTSAPAMLQGATMGAFGSQACAASQQQLRRSFSDSSDYIMQPMRAAVRAQKKHTCKECGKTFNSSSNLCRHRRIHTGKKPYACQFCGFKFNNSSNRKKHERDYCKQRPGANATRK